MEKDATYFDEFFFSRFLVARSWNVEQAHEMLTATKAWRETESIDSLIDTYGAPGNERREFLEQFCPMGVHGVDKRGCPVYVERIGAFDAKGLLSAIDLKDLATHHIYQLERVEQLKRERGIAENGVPFRKHVVIEDLAGLGWGHMTSATIELTKSLVVLDESHYPELLQKLFIINAPWLFNAAWKVLTPLLSERTLNKIEICGSDYLEKIQELVPAEQIPVELGGKCTSCSGPCVQSGGKVPESFYRGGVESDGETVHSVLVPRSAAHEVKVPVAAGGVLCYEFWTDDYDISFGVSFCGKESGAARQALLPVGKCDSHVKHISGDLTAPGDGILILTFDNSYSMFRKKQLYFKLGGTMTQQSVEESDVSAAVPTD